MPEGGLLRQSVLRITLQLTNGGALKRAHGTRKSRGDIPWTSFTKNFVPVLKG